MGQKMRCEANRNARRLSSNNPSIIKELYNGRGWKTSWLLLGTDVVSDYKNQDELLTERGEVVYCPKT